MFYVQKNHKTKVKIPLLFKYMISGLAQSLGASGFLVHFTFNSKTKWTSGSVRSCSSSRMQKKMTSKYLSLLLFLGKEIIDKILWELKIIVVEAWLFLFLLVNLHKNLFFLINCYITGKKIQSWLNRLNRLDSLKLILNTWQFPSFNRRLGIIEKSWISKDWN